MTSSNCDQLKTKLSELIEQQNSSKINPFSFILVEEFSEFSKKLKSSLKEKEITEECYLKLLKQLNSFLIEKLTEINKEIEGMEIEGMELAKGLEDIGKSSETWRR